MFITLIQQTSRMPLHITNTSNGFGKNMQLCAGLVYRHLLPFLASFVLSSCLLFSSCLYTPFFFSLFSAIRKSATLTSNLVDGLGKSLDIARGDPRHGDTAVLGRVDGVLRIRPLDLTIQSKGEN